RRIKEAQEKKCKSISLASVCGFPISIFFIVVNEFCERFSYYGMRAVLVLYFKYFLGWDDDLSTTIYHTFVALCYLTPILGAIVADSWLGKFKTIVYLSIVYALGQVVLAVSAIHDITDTNKDGNPDNMTFHVALSMVGLLLIALGTGGIKPCVAAFGGDQFEDHQEKQRGTFFSIFYLSINAGSLLSTVITPILRAQECGIHTQRECYPLAFGVPAALMVVALIVFIIGSGMYNKTAPQGNIMVKVCKCVGFAVKNRFRHRSSQYPKREHWMDWADEKYDKLLIAQVKMVLKVLFLYIPLPMFWALFDQQVISFLFTLSTYPVVIFNITNYGLKTQPDQMQTVNPILILVLVPIMDSMVYPLIAKCNLNFSPLKRMTVGMFLAAMAFVSAGLVQLQIDETLPKFPTGNDGQVKFINMINGGPLNVVAGVNEFTLQPFDCDINNTFSVFFVWCAPVASINQTLFCSLRFLNGFNSVLNVSVGSQSFGDIITNNMSKYVDIPQGEAKFHIMDTTGNECVYTLMLGFGSSFTLIIPSTFAFGENCANNVRTVVDIQPNSVHMALQIPQYFLITAGEVVFSVTGLEFSYSQAPSNMKSVLQAGWLLTVAVGNIVVLIVAEAATLEDQWAEYILFASLLVFVCIVFAIMAYFYTYTDPVKIEAQFAIIEPEEKEKNRRESLEMARRDSVKHRNNNISVRNVTNCRNRKKTFNLKHK
uniref:Solute carrier family 15 member 1-like n=1 Tax=Gouania willdenowi TaxID=441366 RepID=A0A8C5HFK4_GOUWI